MKKLGIGFLLLALIFVAGCTSKTKESEGNSTTNTEETTKIESQEAEENKKAEEAPKLISEKTAQKIAWQALSKTDWFLEGQEGEEAYYEKLESDQDLVRADLYAIESEYEYDYQYEFGFGIFPLREKMPGKYAKYVHFHVDDDGEKWVDLCLYVNRMTKEVFYDAGFAGVYKLPSNEMVIYYPYAFDGYNDEGFLLQVLEKKKIIPNTKDYITSVSLFWMRYDQEEQEEQWEEETTQATEQGDPSKMQDKPGDGAADEYGKIRLQVMKESDPDTILGSYTIDVKNYTVTDENTGKVLYRDWVPQYKPFKVTKKTAPGETLKILDKLGILDLPITDYAAKVTGEVKKETLESWQRIYGYEVEVTVKNSKDKPLAFENYILRPDGTGLYTRDSNEEEQYVTLYGNWQREE